MHHFMANLSDYPMSCSAQPVDRVGDKLGGPDVGLVFLQATPGGSPATPIPTFRLREKPFRPRPRTGNYVAFTPRPVYPVLGWWLTLPGESTVARF